MIYFFKFNNRFKRLKNHMIRYERGFRKKSMKYQKARGEKSREMKFTMSAILFNCIADLLCWWSSPKSKGFFLIRLRDR